MARSGYAVPWFRTLDANFANIVFLPTLHPLAKLSHRQVLNKLLLTHRTGSSIGKFYVIGGYFVELLESCRLINHFTLVLSLALGSILRSMATLFTVSVSCSLGDSEMGGCWCSWLHVCHICCS